MVDKFGTTGKIKMQNPDDLSRMMEKKLPKTVIEKAAQFRQEIVFNPSNELEEKIVSDYLVEHFQDIGGWKGQKFLSVEDLDKIPSYKRYLPAEIQKFEVQERLLPDSIFDPLPQPGSFSLLNSFQSTAQDLKKPEKIEEKVKNLYEENDFERLIKLKTRNKKVFAMADDLLSRSKHKRPVLNKNFK